MYLLSGIWVPFLLECSHQWTVYGRKSNKMRDKGQFINLRAPHPSTMWEKRELSCGGYECTPGLTAQGIHPGGLGMTVMPP